MPPPYRRNPIADAEAAFFDETPPRRFFGDIGQGRTSFGSYISPRLAINLNREADAYAAEQDENLTKRSDNFTRRLQNRSTANILPHTEAASIASAKLARERAESGSRLNPFDEESDIAQAKLQTAQHQRALESLPEDEAARVAVRDIQVEDMRNRDRFADELQQITKVPRHHLAYRSFRKTLPPEAAYGKALELADDEDAVAAAYEAYSEGKLDEGALNDMLESVDDGDQHFGMRVKPEFRNRARAMLAESQNKRLRFQQEREDRVAKSAHDATVLRSLDAAIGDYQKAVEGGDTLAKDKLKKAAEYREKILDRLINGDMDAKAQNPQKSGGESKAKALID